MIKFYCRRIKYALWGKGQHALSYGLDSESMNCWWQGPLFDVYWPKQDPPNHDLQVELWGMEGTSAEPRLEGSRLGFREYVWLHELPLYRFYGPKLQLYATEPSSEQYFREMAGTEGIGLRIGLDPLSTSLDFDELIVFAETDEDITRLVARPVRSKYSLDQIEEVNNEVTKNEVVNDEVRNDEVRNDVGHNELRHNEVRTDDAVNFEAKKAGIIKNSGVINNAEVSGAPPTEEINHDIASALPRPKDPKKVLQQTVMAALRLRGIRSQHPNFKRLYHGTYNLVSVVLDNADQEPLTSNDIREKVEAILSIID